MVQSHLLHVIDIDAIQFKSVFDNAISQKKGFDRVVGVFDEVFNVNPFLF